MDPEQKAYEDGLRRQLEAMRAEAVGRVAAAKRARPDITVALMTLEGIAWDASNP